MSTTESKPLVLVVDDEPALRRLLGVVLEGAGLRVLCAASGEEGLTLAAQHRPALVLLDLGLPGMGGLEVLRRLREWTNTPVIVLTVQDAEPEKITALDGGADDYVTKPFNTGELLARMRAALRRTKQDEPAPVFSARGLVVDVASHRVTRDGVAVRLSATEWALLRLLVRHAGKVLTHRLMLREVWGAGHEEQTHYLRVYVAHLREKLEADPARPALILTESGIGYRLQPAD